MCSTRFDLLPPVDFERSLASAREVNPATEALHVSEKTGEGLDTWYQWLEQKVAHVADLARPDESTIAMQSSILLFGFGFGMRHAIEADHLAAVSVLVIRKRRVVK